MANDSHLNYSSRAPANVSDVDCASGRSTRLRFTGRANVVGPGLYGLDSGADGVGCE